MLHLKTPRPLARTSLATYFQEVEPRSPNRAADEAKIFFPRVKHGRLFSPRDSEFLRLALHAPALPALKPLPLPSKPVKSPPKALLMVSGKSAQSTLKPLVPSPHRYVACLPKVRYEEGG